MYSLTSDGRHFSHARLPLQELRELTKLDGISCLVREEELELSRTPASLEELKVTRSKNRMDALLTKVRRGDAYVPLACLDR